MKIQDLKIALKPVFQKYSEEVVAVYLFGSLSKEDNLSGSDIDIAVLPKVSGRESNIDLQFRLYGDFCRVLKRNDIDVVVLGRSGNLILQDEIIRTGKILHDGDPEVREEFESRILHITIDFKRQRFQTIGF